MKPKSATVLLLDPQGRALSVSRGARYWDVGMPGGFIEKGETPAEAAARELWEETGLRVHPNHLEPIYEQGGCVTVVLAPYGSVYGYPDPDGEVRLAPQGKWEGHPAWRPVEELASPRATFGKSNRIMLADLGLL